MVTGTKLGVSRGKGGGGQAAICNNMGNIAKRVGNAFSIFLCLYCFQLGQGRGVNWGSLREAAGYCKDV